MSRILVISQLPPPVHGSTVMTRLFLENMEELGHPTRLLDRRFSTSVAEIGKFSGRKLMSATWIPLRLLWAILSFRPTVAVFFVTNRTFSFLVDWLLSEILRLVHLRRVNYVHTIGFERLAEKSRVLAWMVKRLLQSAHTTVLLGPPLELDVSRWVTTADITHIPNAVENVAPVTSQPKPSNPVTLLYLSNFIPEKGPETFVDLAISLAEDFHDVEFIAAGAPTDPAIVKRLTQKVDSRGLSSRVHITGAISSEVAKWSLLRRASLLVFPSSYPFETFGLVLAEALAAEVPIVSYRIGALAPLVEESRAGVVVPVGDAVALEEAVRMLLNERAKLADMGRRGRELYEREFTVDLYRQRWGALLTTLETPR